jgi:ABC-2 type transport system permease protein
MLSGPEPQAVAMMAFSPKRMCALVRKEWIQVTRDALTCGSSSTMPVLQLSCSASPSYPTPEPADRPAVGGFLIRAHADAALQNSGYYDIRTLASEAEAERALAQGEVLFVIELPAISTARSTAAIPRF